MFNPEKTFESFDVGNKNDFPYVAAKAAAENPGKAYNPLLIYGGFSCGKTHLLHAIGHEALKKHMRVLCLSCEKFTNEYIEAVQYNQIEVFRKKCLQFDVLLIDDVENIVGKVPLQENYFHIFNRLVEANKQIVMTCNLPAEDIWGLESRLVSRFVCGQSVELHATDIVTICK